MNHNGFGVGLRGGIEAEKLSVSTNLVGRIHFHKPKNSHEVNTGLWFVVLKIYLWRRGSYLHYIEAIKFRSKLKFLENRNISREF
jgi:hypothetical protein